MKARCDVPNCTNTRHRWQRLCSRCFDRLPRHISLGLKAAKAERREGDWRRLRTEAGDFMKLADPIIVAIDAAAVQRITPQRAYHLQQQMLGERD